MSAKPARTTPDKTTLVLLIVLVSTLTTTPPAPIFVHAEHVLVETPASDDARPKAPAFAVPGRGALAPPLGEDG